MAPFARCANDKKQANAYDNAWKDQWVLHCRNVLAGAAAGTKTAGFVLQIGDSITNDSGYADWPRNGLGKTTEDANLCSWSHSASFPASGNDTSSKNGFYLATAPTKVGFRGMTSARGISTAEFISGYDNGGNAMPATTSTPTAKSYVADGTTFTRNLHYETVSAAFIDAQAAVLMLGTNDAVAGRSAAAFINDLSTIVSKFESKNIVVVLSTIPPIFDSSFDTAVSQYNQQIRSFAQAHGLPLIDFYAEILARQPGTSWNGTLMQLNDLHPSFSSGSYTASSDPYAAGGNAATHTTGDACNNVGYLLRSWLTVQKLKEVQSFVINGNNPVPEAQFSSAASTVNENTATVSSQVTLSFPAISTVTLNFAASNGTAVNGSDFSLAGGTLTFAPGETQKTISSSITNDSQDEHDEAFSISLNNPNGASLGAQASTTITIADDDAPPVLSLASSELSCIENAGPASVVISLSQASGKAISILLATADQSATAGTDYAPVLLTVNFAAGELSRQIPIDIFDNAIDDGDRAFNLSLSNPANATLGTASATMAILNDDHAAINLEMSNYSVIENQSQASITAVLNVPATREITVAVDLIPQSATLNQDYLDAATTLTFAPGETSRTFSIAILDDALNEDDESILISLARPVGAPLGTAANSTLMIADDDALQQVAFSQSIFNASEQSGQVLITARLSAPSGRNCSVSFRTIDGTAKSGTDYETASGSLNFPAGTTTQAFYITIFKHTVHTSSRSFSVLLSDPVNCSLGQHEATVVITAEQGLTLSSAPTAVPNPAVTFQPVSFNVAAVDEGGHVPNYKWDFGDGQTGSGPSPVHLYTAASTYTVTVTATDGPSSVSAAVVVNVLTPDAPTSFDTDGDGFPNDLEFAFGTDANDASSTPAAGQPASFIGMKITGKLRVKLDFISSDRDSINLAGMLPVNEPPLKDAPVTFFIGGVTQTFLYGASSKNLKSSAKFRAVRGTPLNVKFTAKLNGNFPQTLAAHGNLPASANNTVQLPVYVSIAGHFYRTTATPTFRIRQPKRKNTSPK